MLADHAAIILFPDMLFLRYIGRLALPIFAFMVAEGVLHTRSKGKYFLRVFILAVLCQAGYTIFELISGTFAGIYQDLLPTPNGKSYFTFRQGETLFLALDAGNDKPDDQEGLFHNSEMLKEQQDWLRKMVLTEEYHSARWRIILIHMPPCDSEKYDSNAAYSLIRICSESGIAPDLILSGHLHKYLKIIPEAGICNYLREQRSEPITLPLPCPLLANDTDTLIRMEVSETELAAEVIDSHGIKIDQISIRKQ